MGSIICSPLLPQTHANDSTICSSLYPWSPTSDGISLAKVLITVAFGTRSASVGPSPWQSVVPYSFFAVRGMELGKGRGYKKGEAQDEAARMAIGALSLDPAPGVSMLTIRRRKSFP